MDQETPKLRDWWLSSTPELREVLFTPDHARALGISPEGLPVNLADPVACSDWVASWPVYRDGGKTHERWADALGITNWGLAASITAAAQSGTLKLPELKPKVPEAGGVRFVEDKVDRPGGGIDDWWANGHTLFPYYGTQKTDQDVPLRPILPPPRQELKVGDVLAVKGDPKVHPLKGSGFLCGDEFTVDRIYAESVEFNSYSNWCARESIDAAIAAGTLEVTT